MTDLFAQVMDYANRAESPVVPANDGYYLVSTYDEIRSLLFRPKVSSNVVQRLRFPRTGNLFADLIMNPIKERIAHRYRSLLLRDPPEHDALRRHVMRQFTPERMQRMKGRATVIIDELITRMQGRRQIDLVEAFAYPLPIAIICELLGVPAQDEQKFRAWSKSLIAGLDPKHLTEAEIHKLAVDRAAISAYLGALIKEKRRRPTDDVLTGFATCRDKKAGRLNHLISSPPLFLCSWPDMNRRSVSSNGMLTLLRQPEILARLRLDPNLAPRLVEELLRRGPERLLINIEGVA